MSKGTKEIIDCDFKEFNRFNPFRDTKRWFTNNRANLRLVGDLICKNIFHPIVRVSLLHKHFYQVGDERLFRQYQNNASYMKPFRTNNRLLAHMWTAVHSDGDWRFPPTDC